MTNSRQIIQSTRKSCSLPVKTHMAQFSHSSYVFRSQEWSSQVDLRRPLLTSRTASGEHSMPRMFRLQCVPNLEFVN